MRLKWLSLIKELPTGRIAGKLVTWESNIHSGYLRHASGVIEVSSGSDGWLVGRKVGHVEARRGEE